MSGHSPKTLEQTFGKEVEMERTKQIEKRWTWFKGLHGYAVFNNHTKTISHYEQTRIEAVKCCNEWNKENREF